MFSGRLCNGTQKNSIREMRVNQISVNDKVEYVDNLGELCVGKVICRCGGKSCFEVKDMTPDLPEEWRQIPGGGAYQIDRVNHFRGEIFQIKAKDIKRII